MKDVKLSAIIEIDGKEIDFKDLLPEQKLMIGRELGIRYMQAAGYRVKGTNDKTA